MAGRKVNTPEMRLEVRCSNRVGGAHLFIAACAAVANRLPIGAARSRYVLTA